MGKLKQFITASFLLVSTVAHSTTIIPPPPSIAAEAYILVEHSTGHVIASQNADIQLPPASLTKIMTSYIIGNEIKSGNISSDDEVTISSNAWAKNFPESSKMFIEVGKQVSVADLNRGIVIQSGNDACVAMAEHIAGSEDAFANMMNAYAEKLDLQDTQFVNSHGLHSTEHFTTARDMASLASALIRDVPEEYALYKEKSFTYNNIKQYNRNSLLWDKSLNVDGMKTGHTSAAGYSLVSSATKGNMRLVAVVMGTESQRARAQESAKLLKYGFRFFETVTPYKAGEKFATQRIYMGDKETIDLGIVNDISVTIPRGQRKELKAHFTLDQELQAPIEKGQTVGTVHLQLAGESIAEYPLVSMQTINEGGLIRRLTDSVKLMFAD